MIDKTLKAQAESGNLQALLLIVTGEHKVALERCTQSRDHGDVRYYQGVYNSLDVIKGILVKATSK